MPSASLEELLARNDAHTSTLPEGYFEGVQEGQSPAAVSICCSDSRVPQSGMWSVEAPGWLFTPSTIGNQVWDRVDGELAVDGSVLYPIVNTETRTTIVVGHTGCGAVTAALEAVEEGGGEAPDGIAKWVELLAPVIEDGLADERIERDADVGLVDQLVEYNVDRQISYLQESDEIPADEQLFGFVYDFQGVYGDVRGRAYLVNVDGETAPSELQSLVPDEYESHVGRLND